MENGVIKGSRVLRVLEPGVFGVNWSWGSGKRRQDTIWDWDFGVFRGNPKVF